MQKFKIISSMLIALCAGAVMDAMAYDYSFSGEEWRDGDYVYLIDSRDVYFCGSDFSSFLPPEHQAKQMHIINAGGTVYNTATARHNAHLLHIVARDITKMVLFAQNALNWMASAEQRPDIQIMALPVAIYQMALWVLMKWVNG